MVEITGAARGKEFGFWTLGKAANVAMYRIEPNGAGSRLSEHYRLHNPPAGISSGGEAAVKGWCEGVNAGMEQNLAKIKATAEG